MRRTEAQSFIPFHPIETGLPTPGGTAFAVPGDFVLWYVIPARERRAPPAASPGCTRSSLPGRCGAAGTGSSLSPVAHHKAAPAVRGTVEGAVAEQAVKLLLPHLYGRGNTHIPGFETKYNVFRSNPSLHAPLWSCSLDREIPRRARRGMAAIIFGRRRFPAPGGPPGGAQWASTALFC